MKHPKEFIDYPPQEAWVELRRRGLATLPTSPRIKPAVWCFLGLVLLMGAVNVWVILTHELQPLWVDEAGNAFRYAVGVSLLGCVLIFASLRARHSVRAVLMVLGVLLASLIPLIASFAPVVMYVNQSGASSSVTCHPYVVSRKERIHKKYVRYDIELSDSKGLTKVITVSRDQFDGLMIGVRAHVLVDQGLLGIPYVRQITQIQSADECRGVH